MIMNSIVSFMYQIYHIETMLRFTTIVCKWVLKLCVSAMQIHTCGVNISTKMYNLM